MKGVANLPYSAAGMRTTFPLWDWGEIHLKRQRGHSESPPLSSRVPSPWTDIIWWKCRSLTLKSSTSWSRQVEAVMQISNPDSFFLQLDSDKSEYNTLYKVFRICHSLAESCILQMFPFRFLSLRRSDRITFSLIKSENSPTCWASKSQNAVIETTLKHVIICLLAIKRTLFLAVLWPNWWHMWMPVIFLPRKGWKIK